MPYEKNRWLAHYGVKGQVHGRRRWQNEDGSYTPEGRIHYGIGEEREDGGSDSEYEYKISKKPKTNYQKTESIVSSPKKDDKLVTRESLYKGLDRLYGASVGQSAKYFLLGVLTKMAGGALYLNGHKGVGTVLSAFGRGLKFGAGASAVVNTGRYFIAKGKIKNMSISEIDELEKQYNRS